MSILVSVVIPVYNVESYLDECIESVILQSYNNIEIILVDDGSTDTSGNKCDKWAKQDSRIKVIHQANIGLSGARNSGIKISKGRYITFVDSDDTVNIDYINILINSILESSSDISICGLNRFFDGEDSIFNNEDSKGSTEVVTLSSDEAIERIFYQKDISNSAFGKMYPRSFFEAVEFPIGKLYEDLATVYKLFLQTDNVSMVKDSYYNYRIRQGSIMTRKFDTRNLDRISISEYILNNIKILRPNLLPAAKYRYLVSNLQVLWMIPKNFGNRNSIIKQIQDNMKSVRFEVFKDPKVKKKGKLFVVVSMMPTLLLPFFGRIYKSLYKYE